MIPAEAFITWRKKVDVPRELLRLLVIAITSALGGAPFSLAQSEYHLGGRARRPSSGPGAGWLDHHRVVQLGPCPVLVIPPILLGRHAAGSATWLRLRRQRREEQDFLSNSLPRRSAWLDHQLGGRERFRILGVIPANLLDQCGKQECIPGCG